MSPARPFLHDFSDRWLDAWNSHDTNQVLDLLADDVVWDDRTFWPETLHGTEAVRRYTDRIWEAMPDVQYSEMGRFFSEDDEQAIVLFRGQGGPPAKVGGGARFDVHGCDIFLRFEEGRLAHYMASYDITDMMRQLGMLPPRGNRLGGAYLMSLLGRTAASAG